MLKLRLSVIGTLALIIGASTLFFTVILSLIGGLNIFALAFFVIVFNIIQWLIAPYLIDAIYRVREVKASEEPWLYNTVQSLSGKLKLKPPRVMLAKIPIPNAFAYGSPIAGSRVAVTSGLLKELEKEEVEAVLGHELGHLKHRDVQVMMFASVLPAIFYFLGYSMMLSGMFGGNRDRRQGNSGYAFLIGMASMVVYWILTLLVLGLSRLREYYADSTSVSIVEDGSRKLSEALAKIVNSSTRMKRNQRGQSQFSSFKALFIEDPDRAATVREPITRTRFSGSDEILVQDILSRKITTTDRIVEVLSTHPNIVKRLRALQSIA
jgi:heat shock protein HtpX